MQKAEEAREARLLEGQKLRSTSITSTSDRSSATPLTLLPAGSHCPKSELNTFSENSDPKRADGGVGGAEKV